MKQKAIEKAVQTALYAVLGIFKCFNKLCSIFKKK
ncbi:hypothetical protein [Dipodfec virus RodF1_17]|uniref:Uncharacterized protein n=1 Tax=Dipodfec virus RodF1_17 TaxID=2929293 RepID=A0A976N339_9VIRU|nr:hypothetical protein [Dipodfec virus RodF1_17]